MDGAGDEFLAAAVMPKKFPRAVADAFDEPLLFLGGLFPDVHQFQNEGLQEGNGGDAAKRGGYCLGSAGKKGGF